MIFNTIINFFIENVLLSILIVIIVALIFVKFLTIMENKKAANVIDVKKNKKKRQVQNAKKKTGKNVKSQQAAEVEKEPEPVIKQHPQTVQGTIREFLEKTRNR